MVQDLLKTKRIKKQCAVCGKQMEVLSRPNKTYRGGHYFGEIPISSKKEMKKAIAAGTHKSKIGKMTIEVLNKDPKPYKYLEYWECPKCYWG